jgi:hypothetical protein
MRSLASLLLTLATVASCHYASPDLVYVPDNPTYDRDVYPLFSDHCLLCHSHPPNRGAPSFFRLDVYGDTTDGALTILGANTYFGDRALGFIKDRRMPPAARDGEGVGPNGIEMLQRWLDQQKPEQ